MLKNMLKAPRLSGSFHWALDLGVQQAARNTSSGTCRSRDIKRFEAAYLTLISYFHPDGMRNPRRRKGGERDKRATHLLGRQLLPGA